jgi:integrase
MRTKIRRRPNGRWYLFTVDEDGEHAHGGFRTQREAKAKAAELLTEAKRGRYVAPEGTTVGDYLSGEWLDSRQGADISPGTRDVEQLIVRAWVIPWIGSVPLQKLSARDLDRLYRTLRKRGGRGGKGLRGKSVRNTHALLSKAMGDAVRRGHIVANPVAAVDPPARDDSVERTAWSADEVRRFLDVASGDRLGAVWRLALATGLRRGELVGLHWTDVDIEAGTVAVTRQVLVRVRTDGGPRLYLRETTKSRKSRVVRFDTVTAAALRRWKADQGEERLAFGAAYRTAGGLHIEAPWMVTEPDGFVVHPDTLLRRWKALVNTAGVTPITLHGARHSYAELALSAGVRLDVLSRQLGHASIAITADVYGHPDDEAGAKAAERIGTVLGGGRL